nr:hypothetical protein [Streptomyces sp. BR123]
MSGGPTGRPVAVSQSRTVVSREPVASSTGGHDRPFLSLHAAVVLLTALVIGFVVGGLSHLGGMPAPLAVLAGLAAGAAVPVLHGLIR